MTEIKVNEDHDAKNLSLNIQIVIYNLTYQVTFLSILIPGTSAESQKNELRLFVFLMHVEVFVPKGQF